MTQSKKPSKPMIPETSSGEVPDFENSLQALEELVSRLESGDLSLDQSLEHFKRGVALTRKCQSILDQAQKTIDLLSETDDDASRTQREPGD